MGRFTTHAFLAIQQKVEEVFQVPRLLGSNMDVYDLSDMDNVKLVSSGPRIDPSECIGTIVSNGRIFYTCHGGGLQVGLVCGTVK